MVRTARLSLILWAVPADNGHRRPDLLSWKIVSEVSRKRYPSGWNDLPLAKNNTAFLHLHAFLKGSATAIRACPES